MHPMMPQFPQQPQQYPTQPAYPVQPQYPAQQFPQQYAPAPAYPQQYGQPQYPAAPPAQPLPQGTLDGFYGQPSSGGGAALKFNGKPVGTSYAGIVARPITDADVRAQTNNMGQVQTYRDGRPKLVMVVPLQVQPSQEHPEGVATWWVKGQARDELARAMAEAGAPAGPPEAGAAIRITLVGQRPVPNMNPANQYRVEYIRPGHAPEMPAQPQPVQQPVSAPFQVPQQPMPQQMAPVMSTATGQPVVHQQQVPQMPQPAAAPVQQPTSTIPAGFNEDQAALFAKLTGGQQPAQAA